MKKSIHFKFTDYGFEYGGAEITRIASDNKKGWVTLSVKSKNKKYKFTLLKQEKCDSLIAMV